MTIAMLMNNLVESWEMSNFPDQFVRNHVISQAMKSQESFENWAGKQFEVIGESPQDECKIKL